MKTQRQLAVLLLALVAVPTCFAWGSKGHTMINRLAAQSLPSDMPAFMRTPEAINEIAYLGPEPDRWRSRAEPELSAAQAPDHFIDIEYADLIGTLPRQRYQYIATLYAYIAAHPDRANDLRPEKVGFQPYITSEVWERLKSAMRDYREAGAKHEDTRPIEAAILFYAGWLGHYVGDGSHPLHVTIQYNGWTGPNPNGYTTDHTIHWRFEGPYVDTAINTSDVQPLLTPVHPIDDEWDDYLAYLRHTGSLTERVYQLDEQHGFDGAGTPEAKQFTAQRLAAGASMLRDMVVAAWVKSADPVPDWHEEHSELNAGTAAPTSITQSVTPDPLTEKIYDAGGDVKSPVLIGVSIPPAPPVLEPQAKPPVNGVVELVVDRNGLPRNIRVSEKFGKGLDEKVLATVAQYRFRPGTRHGQPVPVRINIQFALRLDQK
jgi:TonB family protein